MGDLGDRLRGASGVVLVVLDGLGALQLAERATLAPILAGGALIPMTSVAPSTTVAALTSLFTGAAPGLHGMIGYRIATDEGVLQALSWTIDQKPAGDRIVPEEFELVEPALVDDGVAVTYVADERFATSCFTRAHLRGANYVGTKHLDEAIALLAEDQRTHRMSVVYHDEIDKVAHHDGLGSTYEAAIVRADAFVAELRRVLADDVALVVTADHGQVPGFANGRELSASLAAKVRFMSGEGRFRWLHANPGFDEHFVAQVHDEFDDVAWVWSCNEAIEAGLFGPVDDEVAHRFGDVAIVPFDDSFIADPTLAIEARMKSRHGSLTPEEVLVPLIVV
jgi:predicted AlkP superfamily pyrophosphatase or phosphodiesterase